MFQKQFQKHIVAGNLRVFEAVKGIRRGVD